MICRSINNKYKNTKTTIVIFFAFVFVTWFLSLILPLKEIFNNKIFLIVSYITLNGLDLWISYKDPTALCATIKNSCRKTKFLYSITSLGFIGFPFLFFMTQLFTDNVSISIIVTILVLTFIGTMHYIIYKRDHTTVIKDPNNQFRCQRNRIFWNMTILMLDIFLNARILKDFNIPTVLRRLFNFPDLIIYILSGLYLLFVMVVPLYSEILGVDQSVKYAMDQIKVT